MPGVYISHSVSPWELAQVYVLARETQQQGLQALIPDRNWQPTMGLPPHLQSFLQQADLVVLFATTNGRQYLPWVNRELYQAYDKRKMALVEQGISVQGIPAEDIITFRRSEDIASAIQTVTQRIQGLQLQQQTSNLVTALVIGGLILLLLRGLGGTGDQG